MTSNTVEMKSIGTPGVEEVAHAVDEDDAGRPPSPWLLEGVRVQREPGSGPARELRAIALVLGEAHRLQPLREGEGVAVVATRRGAVAPGGE